mmetsp:Transcript_18816/g.24819  ORF Transcript_18816/g.24819 Transcript_18816/m.24819 type:complete len:111 (-) Transcript_18816:259-591(-)|eukprot:CAMPEP_0117755072 /NCGR_PEP_ID=MMETSP0947-20121206/13224_1 /TAXON_ID=44440 /ORGANISM="Chattonella subsalsa, Strain CCMP2191" /LENGTH=110 /DNA_ID=CAMNT_0005574317 /DNA_START=113 /DNA_END=445 /DNA_ORIENTATION=-
MSFVGKALQTAVQKSASMYQAALGRRLREFGLRYEDLLIETDDVQKALDRASPEDIANRNRRIQRAIDISLKRKPLPEHIQAVQEPFKHYLDDAIYEARRLRQERTMLNN